MEEKLTYILWMAQQNLCGKVDKYYISVTRYLKNASHLIISML